MVVLAFCLLYSVATACFCGRLGLLGHLDAVMFSTPDSRSYLAVTDYMFGTSKSVPTAFINIRPFAFPLYLLTYRLAGAWTFLGAQWLCNVGSIVLVFTTVWRLTRSMVASLAAIFVLASSLTFTLIALHGLSETLGILLTAGTMYCLGCYSLERHWRYLYAGLFLAALSACTKPTLVLSVGVWLAIWGLRVGGLARRGVRHGWRPAAGHAVAGIIALAPLALQLGFTYAATGKATFSAAGQVNFDETFFPTVYGFAQYGRFTPSRGPEAREAQDVCPNSSSKARFVRRHPRAAAQAFWYLLCDNVLGGSVCLQVPADAFTDHDLARELHEWTKSVNLTYAWAHGVFLVLLPCTVLFTKDRRGRLFIVAGGLLLYMLLAASSMTYWQGDRIVLSAMPVWCMVYAVCGYVLAQAIHRYLSSWGCPGCGHTESPERPSPA